MLQYLEDFYFAGHNCKKWHHILPNINFYVGGAIVLKKTSHCKKRKNGLYSRHTSGVIPPIFLNKNVIS